VFILDLVFRVLSLTSCFGFINSLTKSYFAAICTLSVPKKLPPSHFWRLALDKAWVFYLRVAEGHRGIAPMVRRDIQPALDLWIMVHGAYQKSIKATPKPQGVRHQRTIIEGHRAVKRGTGVPGFRMSDHHNRRMKE
jgi:hypothetical protein